MPTEIEVKFLHVDHDALRVRLKELGATCTHPNRLTKRLTMDFPDRQLEHTMHGWVRVRDQGDKITMSYKQMTKRSLHGVQEVELVVDDFDRAEMFLKALGLKRFALQETKRESWELDNVEIDLDEWPWIHPFVEIEGPSEQAVWDVSEKLGFDRAAGEFGPVEIVYMSEYDITEQEMYSWEKIVFRDVPEWLKSKAKQP